MRILLIGPLSGPINGHTLASQALRDDLATDHQVDTVDLRKDSFLPGVTSFRRVREVCQMLLAVWRKRRGQDVIHLTISQSFAGNVKDLCIYLICLQHLSRLYIHLHGGSIKRWLWDRHPLLFRINRSFIRRLGGVIVSGRSHMEIFDGLIAPERIHIVTNFAQESLFRTEAEIGAKFSNVSPLKVLFISNFIPEKGFRELADAYGILSPAAQRAVKIDFAGRFESSDGERAFRARLDGWSNLRYLGPVDDATKARLFGEAHVFCLPTMFLEGQPISILEAYASGCVVLTTGLGGIPDIFTDGINGFEIQPQSAASIARVFEHLAETPAGLVDIALTNRALAGRGYRTAMYCASLRAILERPLTAPARPGLDVAV